MKLYASTVSNRAMKSQGGEWLKIIIRDENKQCIGYIEVNPETSDKRAIIDIDMLNTVDIKIDKVVQICTDDDTKGKRQKGETYCEVPTLNGFELRKN